MGVLALDEEGQRRKADTVNPTAPGNASSTDAATSVFLQEVHLVSE